MSIPAWQLITLPRARVGVRQWERLARTFRNVDTTVHVTDDSSGLRYGQVTWAADSNGLLTGIAWDWREVLEDAIAISDPMAIQANLDLLDERGEQMSEPEKLLYLNRAIHLLPWQDHVCAHWRRRPEWRMAA